MVSLWRGPGGSDEVFVDGRPIEKVTSQLKMILNEPEKTYPLPWTASAYHHSVQFSNDSIQFYCRVESLECFWEFEAPARYLWMAALLKG